MSSQSRPGQMVRSPREVKSAPGSPCRLELARRSRELGESHPETHPCSIPGSKTGRSTQDIT